MSKPPTEQMKDDAKKSIFQYARQWGESSFPPTLLATLIFPLHAKPFQPIPMLFPPVLLLSSYLNLQGLKKDAAGTSAAWSAMYILLASRRKHRVRDKFSIRGVVRGAALSVGAVNLVGGGLYYLLAKRTDEDVSITKKE